MEEKPAVILFAGKARSGKDTLANYLASAICTDCTVQILSFATPIKELAEEKGWNGEKDNNGRVLLQFIGTEYGRDLIDKNIWVKKLEDRIDPEADFVLIPDLRFNNEVLYFAKKHYPNLTIHVEREKRPYYGNEKISEHKSEQGICYSLIDINITTEENCDFEEVANSLIQEIILYGGKASQRVKEYNTALQGGN